MNIYATLIHMYIYPNRRDEAELPEIPKEGLPGTSKERRSCLSRREGATREGEKERRSYPRRREGEKELPEKERRSSKEERRSCPRRRRRLYILYTQMRTINLIKGKL